MQLAAKFIRPYEASAPILNTVEALSEVIKKNRQIPLDNPLELALKNLLPFHHLKNIDAASELLAQSIMQQKSICIIGDFDTDGATSTALAVSVLKAYGAEKINYLVPNRFKFGYGLTAEIVDAALIYNPELIITVDNGIASFAGVEHAKKLGFSVLITDHHLPAASLPDADVIVNPNQVGDSFPSKNLAGVGVIFYVMMALRHSLRNYGWFETNKIPEPNLAQFLDLVALGTVADVVPLDFNNRILVAQGLARIRAGECRRGIKALMGLSKKKANQFQAVDLGFIIAPRLNAAGRMEDMTLGIECLLAKDEETALNLALKLDLLNQERRHIEASMQQDAYQALSKISLHEKKLPHGICLYEEHWHQGVIGIIAGRVKDLLARPVIAFAKINEQELKGSGRSISGIHIRDVLDQIATAHPDLLFKFGGHAMAAGLSLPITHYETFCSVFDQTLKRLLGDQSFANILYTDGILSSELLNIDTIDFIEKLGPYGQMFPTPLFEGIFDLVDQRLVANRHLKLILKLTNSTLAEYIEGISFNVDQKLWPNNHLKKVRIAYRLEKNEFKNRCNLQLIVEHLEPL